MTLASAVFPLAAYAIGFQTVVYLVLPIRLRTLVAPVVTGVVGAVLTLGASLLYGLDRLGLGEASALSVAGWGVATVAATSVVALLLMKRPETRAELADPRLAALDRRQAFFQIVVRIPVFTALIEEAFFRGLLHAALVALYPPAAALWLGAGLFGMWHIGPAIDQAQAGNKPTTRGAVHTAATVVVMTAAGAFLVWMRMETGSIWVPFAMHAALNMTMAFFARATAKKSPAITA